MARCTWRCVLTAIIGGVDIFEDPGCHFSQQMSSWPQLLLPELVSHELTTYLSDFDHFLMQ